MEINGGVLRKRYMKQVLVEKLSIVGAPWLQIDWQFMAAGKVVANACPGSRNFSFADASVDGNSHTLSRRKQKIGGTDGFLMVERTRHDVQRRP